MKIGVICYPTFGGSGIVATELGHKVAEMGHEVHFISYSVPTRLDKYLPNIYYHAVDIPHYPLLEFHEYTLSLAGKIIDVAKYEQLDILHVHYAIPHAISGFLAKQIIDKTNPIKLVTTLHGTDITLVGLEPHFHPLVKFSLENSDAITAVSKYLADKTISNFSLEKTIEVIPNFVDTNIYKKSENETLKKQLAPNGEKILTHISNFRPVKRVTDVIKIFADVLAEHPARLLLIGDGPDRIEAERLTQELKICKHVRFLGNQSSLVELLSVSDVFLLPSQSESFGLAALEAMSCKVPVVGSNIGGIPELVRHGECGYVAELGDTKRMAKYVLELFENPKKFATFRANSRKSAKDNFDINKIVPKYVELYESLLK